MSRTMMALGDYRFSIDTAAYDTLKRQQSYRWQAQPRLQRHPALQFMGLGKETLDLQGVIYPDIGGDLGQLDSMRAQANKGEPLLLVDGLGFVWGQWIISHITEEQSLPLSNGQPRKQTFLLQLEYYGVDTP